MRKHLKLTFSDCSSIHSSKKKTRERKTTRTCCSLFHLFQAFFKTTCASSIKDIFRDAARAAASEKTVCKTKASFPILFSVQRLKSPGNEVGFLPSFLFPPLPDQK